MTDKPQDTKPERIGNRRQSRAIESFGTTDTLASDRPEHAPPDHPDAGDPEEEVTRVRIDTASKIDSIRQSEDPLVAMVIWLRDDVRQAFAAHKLEVGAQIERLEKKIKGPPAPQPAPPKRDWFASACIAICALMLTVVASLMVARQYGWQPPPVVTGALNRIEIIGRAQAQERGW